MEMYRGNMSDTTVIVQDTSSNKLISDEASLLIQWILFGVVGQIINIFGVATNIINIICFVKQGFKDPVTISLCGLAISDLGCLITIIWINISYTPSVITADLPFDSIELTYGSVGMLHASFSRTTCWITAFVTLERCLCITAPLKVKTIITPQRTWILIACVYVIFISSSGPLYAVNRLGCKYFPHRNRTMIGLVFTEDREIVEKISFLVNNITFPFVAFIVIISCTTILVIKLRSNSKWRMTSTASSQSDNVSTRNQAVSKMVTTISILFIICFVPISIMFLTISMEPSFSLEGKNRNVLIIFGIFALIMESVNSSGNIFVYHRMSSKYRDVFQQLFCTSLMSEINSNFFRD